MIKLMVVDDEFFVRRGIIDSIPWNEYEIEICGEASSGEEALSLLDSVRPDIILSDIKMKSMNGLDFISRAKPLLPGTRFVILSGYEEFDYAKKAVTLGVEDYLLKPLGADELIDIITKIRDEIMKERSSVKEKTVSFQNSVMSAWHTPGNNFSIDSSYFQVFLFSIDNINDLKSYTLDAAEHIPHQMAVSLTESYFDTVHINYIVKAAHKNMYVVMVNHSDLHFDFQTLLLNLKNYLYQKSRLLITIGFGCQYQGYHYVHRSYDEAFSALGYQYAFPDHSIISCCDIPADFVRKYMYNPNLSGFRQETAGALELLNLNYSEMLDHTASLSQQLERKNIPWEDRKTLILKLCILCLNSMPGPSYPAIERKKIVCLYQQMLLSQDQSFMQDFLSIWEITKMALENTLSDEHQNITDIVIRYLQIHYAENISLNMLADMVHVTPNYLSRIFKESTGENFKEWLTRYRIEKSKKLLLDPSLKIYEVAEAVGFYDYKYFSLIFKKYTNYSASEYRILLLNQKGK